MSTSPTLPCTGEPPEDTQVTVVTHGQRDVRDFELGHPVLLRFVRVNAQVVDFYKDWR